MHEYLKLNAELNIIGDNGEIQTGKDKEAARQYFLEHVNPNTVFFHTLAEKVNYMTEQGYWDEELFRLYTFDEVKSVFRHAYDHKFRFPTFVGAYKFYTSYALKNYAGDRYLERYEDRVSMVALTLARGDAGKAKKFVDEMVTGRFQPATPTFLNAGRADAGDLVSCFLLRIEDNMESIGRSITNALQLSKRGGGVALLLTNIREEGAPIKNVEGASSGIVPIMKLLEDSFSYANQLGARQGAGAVYLNAHHPDILKFLDTKRENADEKIRIKTLSLGVVVPDITFELARQGKDMYLFSPYDVEVEYGVPFSDLSVTEHYDAMVENPRIRKTKISARKLFQTIAEIQFESGYPYLLFEDTANRANPLRGRINMSNLCSEILQVNTPSEFGESGEYMHVGQDISCNLGSMNIAAAMENPGHLPVAVATAVDALTSVVHESNIQAVPPIAKANYLKRSVGLGQMNLHGFLAQNKIHYGSEESIEFVHAYFSLVRYHALKRSCELAKEYGPFESYYSSKYDTGEALEKYKGNDYRPTSPRIEELFDGVVVPGPHEWAVLADEIEMFGLYHSYLLAVPPTGNISYVNGSTPSIHPVTGPVEIRKEGKMGRVYYPAPGLSRETLPYYTDAYSVGYEKLIDVYAAATEHTDQGLSLTLFLPSTATTRDLNKAQIYAWRKGIKTMYYLRTRQEALEGTGVDSCLSCTL